MPARRTMYVAALTLNWALFVTAGLLWATSSRRHYQIVVETGGDNAVIELFLRDFDLTVTAESGTSRNGNFAQVISPADLPTIPSGPPQELTNKWWRIQWASSAGKDSLFMPPWRTRSVRCPFWFAIVPVAVWPLIALIRLGRRRRRSAAAGRCAGCGYDMRATPDRCPECGARPQQSTAA